MRGPECTLPAPTRSTRIKCFCRWTKTSRAHRRFPAPRRILPCTITSSSRPDRATNYHNALQKPSKGPRVLPRKESIGKQTTGIRQRLIDEIKVNDAILELHLFCYNIFMIQYTVSGILLLYLLLQ